MSFRFFRDQGICVNEHYRNNAKKTGIQIGALERMTIAFPEKRDKYNLHGKLIVEAATRRIITRQGCRVYYT